MKANEILSAMGQIDEAYIEEAAPGRGRSNGRLRKWSTAAAAAILLFMGVMGTAMAVSANFRQMVFSFFHIKQVEAVPEYETEGACRTQSDIGGLIKAEYIRLDGSHYDFGVGTLSQADYDENRVIRSICFWSVENGSLHSVDTKKTYLSVEWDGRTFQGDLYWCHYNGEISVYAVPEDSNGNTWYANAFWGRTDAVMLYLSHGRYYENRQYPLLYHLDTGETEDILAQTGVKDLPSVSLFEWSNDLNKVVLLCSSKENPHQFYYCDIAANTLTKASDLCGFQPASVFFADDNTLLFVQYTGSKCSVFAYDITAGTMVQTCKDKKIYEDYGMKSSKSDRIMLFGGWYGLYVDPSYRLSVIDFKTGNEMPVEGFTFETGGSFLSNPSNTKMIYSVADATVDEEALGLSKLGMLDVKTGIFTAFDREGYDRIAEWLLGWFDENRVAIRIGEPGEEYMYLYDFSNIP